MGYAFSDALYADRVLAITDNVISDPLSYISIDQTHTDYVVKMDRIGDPAGIESGTTRITTDATRLKIASLAAQIIETTGYLKDGFSFQTGAGGTSLAVADYIRGMMKGKGIVGSIGLGGVTKYFVNMLEEKLFHILMDVQCFDLEAIESLRRNENHIEIGASMYANPHAKGNAVSMVDVAVLSAAEVDVDFNVNVTTRSTGEIMGGSGGHSDAAAGSALRIIVAPLTRSSIPIVIERVTTVTTPGDTVDVVVTEEGIAVNNKREDIKQRLVDAGLSVVEIGALKDLAYERCGKYKPTKFGERVLAVQEYCDGTVIDVIRQA